MNFLLIQTVYFIPGREQISKILLENGADRNIKNKQSKTAEDLAKEEGKFG